MSVTTMLIGKYKGTPIRDLSDDYVHWILAQEWLRDPLLTAIKAEAERRGAPPQKSNGNGNGKPARSLCPSPEIAMDLVARGERAVRRDPDYAVDADENLAALLTASADWLRKKIGESR
jgi:hypothetical protein